MSALRILLVGLNEKEINQCAQIWGVLNPEWFTLTVNSTASLEKKDWAPGFDLALVACRGDSSQAGTFFASQDFREGHLRVIALTDNFEPENVVQLMNSGAQRVIPIQRLEELLPACISGLMAPQVARAADRLQKPGSNPALEQQGRLPQPGEDQGAQGLLEAVLNAIDTIVVVLDRSGRIEFINHPAETITGYPLAEVRGRNIADFLILPEEKKQVQAIFQRLGEGGPSFHSQNTWLTKDGISRRIDWENTGLINSEGNVDHLVAAGVDITDQVSNGSALRQSGEPFARIFQASPMGIGIVRTKDGCFIDANESLLRILECGKEQLLSLSPVEVGLLAAHEMQEFMEKPRSQGFVLNLEHKLNLSARRSLRVVVSLEIIEWIEEPAILMIVHDVTERWQAEEKIRKLNGDLERRVLERTAALQAVNRELADEIGFRKAVEESSQRLIQIIWETPDVVGICNLDGHLLYANKAARRMFGFNETDPVGHISVFDVYPEDLRSHIQTEISAIVEREGLWKGETEFILPTGRRIAISQVLLAHKDLQGKVMFFSTIARDISEQKLNSIETEKAYRREKELGSLRTNFFAMTSHQFRTPLSAILSSAELLEHYGGQWGTGKHIHHLQRIQQETQRMTVMLDNILTISKIESTSFDANFEELDLCELIQQSVQEVETIDGGKHTFHLDCVKGPLMVQTSPEIIHRIFENLFTNAMKYAPAGTSIEIRLYVVGKDAEIAVQDHGIGIPEEEIGMVFQPFFRGSNVADTPGTGLGMLIVQKSIQNLGGGIQIHSKLGEGTRVVVQIPLRKANDGANISR